MGGQQGFLPSPLAPLRTSPSTFLPCWVGGKLGTVVGGEIWPTPGLCCSQASPPKMVQATMRWWAGPGREVWMEGQSLEEDTLPHTRASSAPGKGCSFWVGAALAARHGMLTRLSTGMVAVLAWPPSCTAFLPRMWRKRKPGLLPSIPFLCAQSLGCVQLRNPMDCSPPGSSIHEVSQASILEWVAISYSRGSS